MPIKNEISQVEIHAFLNGIEKAIELPEGYLTMEPDSIADRSPKLHLPDAGAIYSFQVELENESMKWLWRYFEGPKRKPTKKWNEAYNRCNYLSKHGKTNRVRKKNLTRLSRLEKKARKRWNFSN